MLKPQRLRVQQQAFGGLHLVAVGARLITNAADINALARHRTRVVGIFAIMKANS